jgi:hypothetical protein
MLVLVDEQRTGTGDEGDRIGLDRRAGRGIIEVEDRAVGRLCNGA